MSTHSIEDITQLLSSTKDPRFQSTIKSIHKFYSLSNAVYKVEFEENDPVVVKINSPENVNLLTFYKENSIMKMTESGYGNDLFLYSSKYLEIERFIKSKGLTQQDFIDDSFRCNIMRNAAEFNSISFNDGQENFFLIMMNKGILDNIFATIKEQMITYTETFKLAEDSKAFVNQEWTSLQTELVCGSDPEDFFGN